MKKHFTWRVLSTLLAICLLATCLAACSSPASSSQAATSADAGSSSQATGDAALEPRNVTIKFDQFNINGDNEKYLKQMIEAFNAVYPDIKIELQTVPFQGYVEQLMAKVSAGQAADIYELSYEQFPPFAAQGVLMPVNDLADKWGIDLAKYNTRVLDSFTYDGVQYGLPNSFSNVVMFYNKDLFDQAGLDYPTTDWTWKEQLEAAQAIRALGDEYFGFTSPISYNALFKAAAQNGGSLISEDGKSFTVNTPEVVGAVEYMVDMVSTYNVQPTSAQLGGMGDWDLFKSGRLGMILTGIWAMPDFLRDCDFAWDMQVEPGNMQKATNFFCNSFVINKDSEVADEAMLFLDFLCSSQEVVDIRIDANLQLPAVADEAVISRYTSITPPDNRAAVFESLDYLTTMPVVEQSSEMQDIVNAHLQSVVTGQATAQEAMDACQAELESKITL